MSEEKIEELISQAKTYSKLQVQLLKLRGIEATAVAGSDFASRLFISAVLALACIFMGIAGAFYLSRLLGSIPLGFLITGAFFLMLALILRLSRKKLLAEPLKNRIIYTFSAQNSDQNV